MIAGTAQMRRPFRAVRARPTNLKRSGKNPNIGVDFNDGLIFRHLGFEETQYFLLVMQSPAQYSLDVESVGAMPPQSSSPTQRGVTEAESRAS